MARYYTARDFFRQMPKGLLARYFQGWVVLGDLDFTACRPAGVRDRSWSLRRLEFGAVL